MVTAATVDIGDADTGAMVELVSCGATHLVQIVLVLVDSIVEMLVACMTEVEPLATLVVVSGQLVTVVETISVTTLATVDCAVTTLGMADDVGVTTLVVAGCVDVTMTFDVTGVLRAGQSSTVDAQVEMIISLVLKTVFSGTTVVVGFMLEETMLVERLVLCMELELAVLLMALMLFQLPLLSVYSYCIAGLALVIFTLLT